MPASVAKIFPELLLTHVAWGPSTAFGSPPLAQDDAMGRSCTPAGFIALVILGGRKGDWQRSQREQLRLQSAV
jgi:hypothetical protein